MRTPAAGEGRSALSEPERHDAERGAGARRIGLVIGQLTAGGAEGQLTLFCRDFDRATFAPMVYCLSGQIEPYGPRIKDAGVPLRVIRGNRMSRVQQLRRHLVHDRIELVHAWLYIANTYAWLATRGLGRPLITSARNCKVQSSLSRLLNGWAFRASRGIIVNSHDVGTYIERHYGAPAGRIRTVYNAIDIQRFHPSEERDGSEAGPIITIGRLVEQKDHALFLQAAALLARDVPQARFMIVGDGPLRVGLAERAATLGIGDRVTFTGERRDVEVLLRDASLFWLTSRWEGMPNVVLEAMASGVPVIATNVGGVGELIRSGIDGVIVGDRAPEGFVQPSRELLQNQDRWRRCAVAARARAEEFSVAQMVGTLSQTYHEIFGQGR